MRDVPDLIIFDCDGVLVDTERLTNTVMASVVTTLGWPMTADESIERFKGKALETIRSLIEAHIGAPVPGFADSYRAAMFAAMEGASIEPIPGAIEVLDALDAPGSPGRCVASNGPVRKMLLSLTSAGLLDRFAQPAIASHLPSYALFSAYAIERYKPDPGVFLCAAESSGVDPAACVVVEDSPSGVRAGVSGGMRVVGLAGLTPGTELAAAGAHSVIHALSGLLEVLGLARGAGHL